MNEKMKSYTRHVRLAFPVFKKNEKRFFQDFKASINEYDAIHPQYNYEDLVNSFGTPQEVVIQYFNNMDSKEYLALMRKSLYLKFITYVAVALLIIFFSIQTYTLHSVRTAAMETIVTTEEVTINYE